MPLLTRKTEAEKEILERIADLEKRLTKLNAQLEVKSKELGLSDEVVALKKKITELEISKSKLDEEHAREKREVEHATGLLKDQAEFDRAKAVDEAKLAVREENLSNEREAFEKEMVFTRERLEKEIERMASMYEAVLDRLPHVKIDRSIREGIPVETGNGNGSADEG